MPRHALLATLTGLAVAATAPAALAGGDRAPSERSSSAAAAAATTSVKSTAAKRAAAERRAAVARARAERRAERRRTVPVMVRACVVSDAVQTGAPEAPQTTVGLRVLAANAHARRAGLLRGTEFTAKLDGTVILLVGRARAQEGTRVRLPRLGTFDSLDRGDVVGLHTRVTKAAKRRPVAQWDTFGSWRKAVDHGPVRPRVCPDPPSAPAPAPAPSA